MNERSREDDTGAELLDDGRHPYVDPRRRQLRQGHGEEDTDGAGDEDDEEGPNAQRHVVVAAPDTAARAAAATLRFSCTNAVPA